MYTIFFRLSAHDRISAEAYFSRLAENYLKNFKPNKNNNIQSNIAQTTASLLRYFHMYQTGS